MKFLLKGSPNIGLLVLRVLMGLGIASHGYQKLFTPGILDKFTAGVERLGFPAPGFFAWLAALSEFAGGIFIALGLGTRLSALFVFFTMCVAFFRAHAADPFNLKEPACFMARWR
jgi:putative oxidoreductase